MMCYRDTTYCRSPNCKNECGRQLREEWRREAIDLGLMIAWGYFCDKPEENIKSKNDNE